MLGSASTSGTKRCRSRSLHSHTVESGHLNAPSDPAVERLHPMPVIEPVSSDDERIEERGGRSRIGLTVQYLKAHRRPAALVLVAAAIVGTATAILLPSTYT